VQGGEEIFLIHTKHFIDHVNLKGLAELTSNDTGAEMLLSRGTILS
jgi:hypothetical protein